MRLTRRAWLTGMLRVGGAAGAAVVLTKMPGSNKSTTEPIAFDDALEVDGRRVHVRFVDGMMVIVANPGPPPGVRRGYVSTGPDHDEAWFTGATNPLYLAEKFLTKSWNKERAIAELRESPGDSDCVEAAEMLEITFADEAWYLGWLIDGVDCSDGVPGEGYDPLEVAWLAQVQSAYRARRIG